MKKSKLDYDVCHFGITFVLKETNHMTKQHHYKLSLTWTGNRNNGTTHYTEYDRSYTVRIEGKPDFFGSSDVVFMGDGKKYNPEDMMLMALSSCHMLWYLHLCADAGIVVLEYSDSPTAALLDAPDKGYFTNTELNPKVRVADQSMVELATTLHKMANQRCFIANSCNFPVHHHPITTV